MGSLAILFNFLLLLYIGTSAADMDMEIKRRERRQAAHTIPALTKALHGMDITILDLFASKGGAPAGFLEPVLKFTYSTNQIYTAPGSSSQLKIPDHSTVERVASGNLDDLAIFAKTEDAWQSEVVASLGLSYGDKDTDKKSASTASREGRADDKDSEDKKEKPKSKDTKQGMLRASVAYKNVQEVIKESSKSILINHGTINSFRLRFNPDKVQLEDGFMRELRGLPAGINYFNLNMNKRESEFVQKYTDFISHRGTHYCRDVLFGGVISMTTTTINNLHKTMNETSLKLQAKIAFNHAAADAGYETKSSSVSSEFYQKTDYSMLFYGGVNPQSIVYTRKDKEGTVGDKTIFAKWSTSVSEDPWIVAADIAPLYFLEHRKEVRNHLKTAIETHIYKSYISDLSHRLQQTLGNWDVFDISNRHIVHSISNELKHNFLHMQIDYDKYEAPFSLRKDVQLCGEAFHEMTDVRGYNEYKSDRKCAPLNEWISFKIPSPQVKWNNVNFDHTMKLNFWLKSTSHVDFAHNGCIIRDHTSWTKELCAGVRTASKSNDFLHKVVYTTKKDKTFWDWVAELSPASSFVHLPNSYRHFTFPGKWEFAYDKGNKYNNQVAPEFAFCMNFQDKDAAVEGVDRSGGEDNFRCFLLNGTINEEKTMGMKNYFSFSLRDRLHPG